VTAIASEPLRRALLERAGTEAGERLAAADSRAEQLLTDAEERGAALVERARAEGTAAAHLAGAYEEAQARRRAHMLVLTAKRDLYDELCREARIAAEALRHDSRYPALLDRLVAQARAQLGNDATLEIDPPDGGGVRASKGPRHVDYTLEALVERCLGQLGERLNRLWA
jgi:vacuolar-type H+-ATPase subunit E/Vma4